MNKSFFVMVNLPRGGVSPLVNVLDDVMLFENVKDANDAAARNVLAESYGYEVFRCGNGE